MIKANKINAPRSLFALLLADSRSFFCPRPSNRTCELPTQSTIHRSYYDGTERAIKLAREATAGLHPFLSSLLSSSGGGGAPLPVPPPPQQQSHHLAQVVESHGAGSKKGNSGTYKTIEEVKCLNFVILTHSMGRVCNNVGPDLVRD